MTIVTFPARLLLQLPWFDTITNRPDLAKVYEFPFISL